MSNIILTVFILLVSLPTIGQVGINTSNPQETLHVNGKIRVDDADGRSASRPPESKVRHHRCLQAPAVARARLPCWSQ